MTSDEITSHLRPQLLGRMTQRAVVETLKSKGPLTRADISRLTGISPTTVSSAVTQVLRAGLIEEIDATISGPGRPGRILRLNIASAQVIGVSIEPEWCEIVVGGLDGKPTPSKCARFPTPNTYSRLLAEIDRHARVWIEPQGSRILGIGVSLPGLIDPSGERSIFSPNLHQTDGQRPGRDLKDRLGIPTVVLQESDALCLAERRVHSTDDLAIIDYAGGLGLGILTGGRLLGRDLRLPRELGHITVVPDGIPCGCGNFGCLETMSTDNALARLVSAKLGQPLTLDEVIDAIRCGRVDAQAEIEIVLNYLAVAVAATVNLFAPPLIVIHGRLLDLAPDLLDRLAQASATKKLAPYRDHCKLVKASTTKAQGALAGMLDFLFEELGPLLPSGG